jgi:hypothetical protein
MLFRIDGPPDGGDIPEYGLIELQGRIEQQHEVPAGEPVPVGTVVLSNTVRWVPPCSSLSLSLSLLCPHLSSLTPPPSSKKPKQQHPDVVKITIGYHEIEGKRIALKRPLAILERQQEQQQQAAAVPAEADAEAVPSQGFAVVGVVRHRFLFKGRPRALITKPGEARGTMADKHKLQREEASAVTAATAAAAAAEQQQQRPVAAG